MSKTPEQREAARLRRLARKDKADGEYKKQRKKEREEKAQPKPFYTAEELDRRGVSKGAYSFDPTDYSPRAGYRKTQRQVAALAEELLALADEEAPDKVTFQHVGNMAAARVHLEKAIAHLKDTKACLRCPTNTMSAIRDHWKVG